MPIRWIFRVFRRQRNRFSVRATRVFFSFFGNPRIFLAVKYISIVSITDEYGSASLSRLSRRGLPDDRDGLSVTIVSDSYSGPKRKEEKSLSDVRKSPVLWPARVARTRARVFAGPYARGRRMAGVRRRGNMVEIHFASDPRRFRLGRAPWLRLLPARTRYGPIMPIIMVAVHDTIYRR